MTFFEKIKAKANLLRQNTRFGAFGGGAAVTNAAMTFGFGYIMGSLIFGFQNPQISALLAGSMFTFVLDGGAYGWRAGARRKGISPEQRTLAIDMAEYSTWCSTGVSAAFLLVATPLFKMGGLTDVIASIGIFIVAVMLSLHFINLFKYRATSPEAQKAELDGALESELKAIEFEHEAELAEKIQQRVSNWMIENVDKIADEKAQMMLQRIMVRMEYDDGSQSSNAGNEPEALLSGTDDADKQHRLDPATGSIVGITTKKSDPEIQVELDLTPSGNGSLNGSHYQTA